MPRTCMLRCGVRAAMLASRGGEGEEGIGERRREGGGGGEEKGRRGGKKGRRGWRGWREEKGRGGVPPAVAIAGFAPVLNPGKIAGKNIANYDCKEQRQIAVAHRWS